MTALDPESVRRAQAEQRISQQTTGRGSTAMWFIVIVAVLAVIGAIMVFGNGNTSATMDQSAPVAVEETAPAAPVAE